jgi:hypothetical protein
VFLPEYFGMGGSSWPLYWPSKDPHDANIDYSLDVSSWLLSIGDNAQSVQAVWEPNNPDDSFRLTAVWIEGSVITTLASGGTAWFTYDVRFDVVSQIKHQTLSRTVSLPVVPLYTIDVVSQTSGMVSGVVIVG